MSESSISISNIKVNMEDLRQDLRGKFMNLVGNPESQDKKRQSILNCLKCSRTTSIKL
jgi:hypothetical protein